MKIKRKLLFEVLISYTLLIIFLGGGVLGAALIRYRKDGMRMEMERDFEYAMHIGDFIRLYYRTSGTLEGLDTAISRLFFQRSKIRHYREDNSVPPKEFYKPPEILVLDSQQKEVLYSNPDFQPAVSDSADYSEGVRVSIDETVLAYVYVGILIPGKSSEFRLSPELRKTMTLLVFYSVLLILFSICLGLFFGFRIAKPINDLIGAFEQVSRNQFSVRLKNDLRNEMGVLLKSFNIMMQKLEEADKARKQLSADISHDLRTPLALIRGRLEMIQEGVYRADQSNLDYIMQEVEHLSHMLEEWRQMSRIEAGSLENSTSDLELNAFLKGLFQSFYPMKEANNLVFDFVPAKEPLHIMGDRENLSRAFGNLIVNAVKFSKPNGLIRMTLRREGNEALVSLFDNGIGIPSDKIRYIFDRHYKVDSSRGQNRSGSGLGLPICKSIINAHGGTVTVSSVEGKSTVFFIRIPLA